MNISHKILSNNSFSSDKIQYYQKILSKYIIAINKIQKEKKILVKYRQHVLDWLFSYDLETRMIICCVENKRYTNIMNKLYLSHKDNKNTKFIIKDEKEESSSSLKDNENISFFYSNEETPQNVILESFLNEIIFYQCESPIKNLNNYSDYFTLNGSVLNDRKLFQNYFSKISKEKYFNIPIKTHDPSTKFSNFKLPEWICNNDSTNNRTYFTISEYFCGLFEQVISVRFITSYNNKNLNEILSSCYLKELFDKSKIMINYLNRINDNKFHYFKIDELIEEMYKNKDLENFILKNSNIDTDNISGWFANPLYFDKSHNLDEIKDEVNHFFGFDKISNEELIKMISLFHIRKLLTYDDFLCRGIFERIYNDYTDKITEDLITDINFDNKKKNKKKKKKQKKKDMEKSNCNENNIELNLNNEISDFVKTILLNICNNVVEKCDLIEKNINNNNNINHKEINYLNEKKKKKIKENKFFLYETVKKDIKNHNQKKLNIQNYQNSIIDIEKNYNNEEEFQYNSPIIQNITTSLSEISNEKNNNNKNILSPISQINSKTISSNNSSTSVDSVKNSQKYYNKKLNNQLTNNIFSNNILDNQYFFQENPLISLFDNLNNDITNYLSEQEIILNKIYKIKLLIYEYLLEITKKIYPYSKLEIYGSTLYKLDIESSDLDLSILSKENLSLSLLINELNNNYNTIFESIFPILSASIPVIKLILNPIKLKNEKINYIYNQIHLSDFYKNYFFHKNEIDKIRIDITINSINYNQVNFIQNSLLKYPSIFPIIKILKRCLNEKKMNQTFKGGMSSYILFLLVYSFTKRNILINNKIDSPGELLINFLFYYIKIIDFSQTLINPNLSNPFILCNNLENIPTILDPITKINAAKSVFKIFDVVKVFNFIYTDIYMIYSNFYDEELKEEKKGNIIKILFQNFHNK